MKPTAVKWIAFLLCLCLTLTGCSGMSLDRIFNAMGYPTITSFNDIQYTQPDVEEFCRLAEECIAVSESAESAAELMEYVYPVFTAYYDFQTNYALANIYYCQDLTDIYWEDAYNQCMSQSTAVSAAMDEMLYALADCRLREDLESEEYFGPGYFDCYEGESIWDETFTGLMNQESELIGSYYDLNTLALDVEYYSEEFFNTCGLKMAELYVELVRLRQQIADYAGYDSYADFAYDFYYSRDYSPAQAEVLMESIRAELVPFYKQYVPQLVYSGYGSCSESQTYSFLETRAEAMGGTVADAFQTMSDYDLYDITFSTNKYNTSFEVYLYSYNVPFVFLNPTGYSRDQLTFAHEFGHFCSDYASGGSVADIDVAEIFSQGMEYLCLCYGDVSDDLIAAKMGDSLSTFVEQSAYASFEQAVYRLEGDDLNVDAVFALYGDICSAYGLDIWSRESRDFVLIPHLFTNPFYIISYVVSNDAALQIYEAELAAKGGGLELLVNNLATLQPSFLAFLEEAGLENPFREDRGKEILATFQTVLNPLSIW